MNTHDIDSHQLVDPIRFNDELNPALFAGFKLKPEVHRQLLEIAADFKQFLGVSDLELKDITISGSNAAYTYTSKSDIDLHLVADLPQADESDIFRELFDAKKYQYNTLYNITVKGYNVELYVQNANEKHISSGIYSLTSDDWVSIPKKQALTSSDVSVKSKVEDLLARARTALKAKNSKDIGAILKKMADLRRAGLEQGGELSPENLAYKTLRANGIIDRLHALKNASKSAELSLETADSQDLDVPTRGPRAIAAQHRVPVQQILKQLKLGIEVESEHTTDPAVAREIALDHLAELPDYYSRLRKMEQPLAESLAPRDLAARFRQDIEAKYPGVAVDLFAATHGGLHLSKIEIPKSQRRLGLATEILKGIAALADRTGLVVSLSPTNEFGTPRSVLVEFYKRFGFVMNRGRNKDYRVSELMYREPKTLAECAGRITPQNQTIDVGPDEIVTQAAKFGNVVDRDGYPEHKLSALLHSWEQFKRTPVSEAVEDLVEVNMAPGKIAQWINSPAAAGVRVGFEAELIFPGYGVSDSEVSLEFVDDWTSTPVESLDQIISMFPDGYAEQKRLRLAADHLNWLYNRYVKAKSRNGGEPDEFGQWARSEGVETINDFVIRYRLEYPMASDDGQFRTEYSIGEGNRLADDLGDTLGIRFRVLNTYHGDPKNNTDWYIEPDGSINTDGFDHAMGAEIVSPPLLLQDAISIIPSFFRAVNQLGAVSNRSTGLHISVSIDSGPLAGEQPNYLKLVLFLGDEYVLSQFGRSANEYAASAFRQLSDTAPVMNAETEEQVFGRLRRGLTTLAADSFAQRNSSRYSSINIKSNYVEFRAAGGKNYAIEVDKILATMYRYAYAYSIAADPLAYKQEYAKKLYTFLSNFRLPVHSDTIQLFSNYAVNGNAALLKQGLGMFRRAASRKPAAQTQPETEAVATTRIAAEMLEQWVSTQQAQGRISGNNLAEVHSLITELKNTRENNPLDAARMVTNTMNTMVSYGIISSRGSEQLGHSIFAAVRARENR